MSDEETLDERTRRIGDEAELAEFGPRAQEIVDQFGMSFGEAFKVAIAERHARVSFDELLTRADEFAKAFEDYEPEPEDRGHITPQTLRLAKFAAAYLSGFDEANSVPVEVRPNVAISVRFSEEEIARLRREADEVGVSVIDYIKSAALNAGDRVEG